MADDGDAGERKTVTLVGDTNGEIHVAPSEVRDGRAPRTREDRAERVHITVTETALDEEDRERFEAIVEAQRSGKVVPEFWAGEYRDKGARYWQNYYKANTVNGFKDRHYIDRLFGELKEHDAAYRAWLDDAARTDEERAAPAHEGPFARQLFEVGCGVGNAFLPLQRDFPWLRCVGVDISSRAVRMAAEREDFDAARTAVWPCDLAKEPLPAGVNERPSDFATLIFVLSAIAPAEMPAVLRKAHDSLRPGGLFLVRDYGAWDMAMLRFKAKNYIDEFEYARHNGTLTYFFTLDKMRALMEEAGFEVLECVYHRKIIRNVKRDLTMKRVWIHVKARRPP